MEGLEVITRTEDCENMDKAFLENYGIHLSQTLPDAGDVSLVPLKRGTAGGNPIVAITFTAQMPATGRSVRVQTVTTMRLFLSAADMLRARYGDLIK